MIRPYIYAGATIIISLLVFCQLGFWGAVAATIAALVCCAPLFFFRNKNNITNSIFICCLSLLVSSSAFITKTVTDYQPAMLIVSDETKTLSGTLYEYEQAYGKHYYTLTDVAVNGIEIDHKVRVTTEIYKSCDIDDRFSFDSAVIYELGSSTGSQDNYKADNIYLGAYIEGDFQVTKCEQQSAKYYLEQIRQYISLSLRENMNPRYAAVANAMLTGYQSDIDDSDILNFRYSGIAHLFAVSGFHLSLWTGALSLFLSKIFRNKTYIGNIISIIFVLFFMALTGFTKSVMRAGIMIIITLAGRIIKHKSDPINSLFIAATIILLMNPYAVMSISLQMSFLATLGILILADPVTKPIVKLKGKIRYTFLYRIISSVYTTVMISVIASLFTMPVSALNFGYISVAAPLTNLLCMFPSEILILLSGIYTIVLKLSFIAKPVALICTYLTKFILLVTDWIASMKHSVMDTTSGAMQIILMTIIVLMAVFLVVFRKNDRKLRHTLFCSASAIAVIAVCAVSVQSSSVKITVADVGNGTAVVFHTADSDVIISGGGSTYKSYKLTNITDRNQSKEFDLLLIPRNTKTESEYAYTLLKRYEFKNCIFSDEQYPPYITELLPENSFFTNNCNIQIDSDTTLIYNNSEEFSGVRILSGNFTCTILFRPLSDFDLVPESWASGALLITRQSLPDIDLSGFENIIVSSSKEVIYDNANIYTTRYSGQTDYRMYPLGTSVITEEKHDY